MFIWHAPKFGNSLPVDTEKVPRRFLESHVLQRTEKPAESLNLVFDAAAAHGGPHECVHPGYDPGAEFLLELGDVVNAALGATGDVNAAGLELDWL